MHHKTFMLAIITSSVMHNAHAMVQKRPRVQLPRTYDVEKTYPLFQAIGEGDVDVVRSLLQEGGDPNGKYNGDSPLSVAIYYRRTRHAKPDIMETLIDFGAHVNEQNRLTPLLIQAVDDNQINIVRTLLQRGANVTFPDLMNRTALHYAVEKGNSEMVELLVAYGASISKEDTGGATPIRLAELQSKKSTNPEHKEIAGYLKRVKAERAGSAKK